MCVLTGRMLGGTGKQTNKKNNQQAKKQTLRKEHARFSEQCIIIMVKSRHEKLMNFQTSTIRRVVKSPSHTRARKKMGEAHTFVRSQIG